MALSSASFVPEPMEKCAVAAASPSSTMFSWCQRSHSTRGKFSQAEPRRCARVGHQRMAAEVSSRRSARRSAIDSSCVIVAEAEAPPGRLGAFDDEGRRVGIELVGVRPHPAVLGLLEDEGEGVVEFLVRAEPDELALRHVDVGLEDVGEFGRATLEFSAVGGDDEVVVARKAGELVDLGLEAQLDAELARARPAGGGAARFRPMPQKPWPAETVSRGRGSGRRCRPSRRNAPRMAAALTGIVARRGCRASRRRARRPSRTCRRAGWLDEPRPRGRAARSFIEIAK